MLRSMREGVKGPAGKVLLAIIIVPFVFIGGMELFTGDTDSVLSVNGEDVSQGEYVQELYVVRNEVAAQMGENISPDLLTEERLNPMVFERLTQRKLLQQMSAEGNMSLPESGVNQAIVESPQFQENGKFSESRYRQVIASGNITELSLRAAVEEFLRGNQLQNGLVRSGFGVSAQNKLIKAIVSEQRKINLLKLSPATVSEGVEISESALSDRYESTKSKYQTGFTVDAEYLVLDMTDLVEPVSEEALLEAYEEEKANFGSSERRNVAHILLEVSEQQSAEKAEELLLEIKARAEAGEAFAALAEEFSQDPGSASSGGELGFIERDETFPIEFEEAAFSLQEGELSGVIKTDAGLHLLTVTAIEVDEIDSFEERREFIEQQLQLASARKLYVEKLEQLGEETYNAADLQGPANTLGLELQSLKGVPREGRAMDSEEPVFFSNPAVLDALFSGDLLDEGLNSEPIEVSEKQAIVLRVATKHEPRQRSLEEVRAILIAELTKEKAQLLLREKLDSIKSRVDTQNSFTDVAAAMDLDLQADLELDRNRLDFDREFIEALFKTSRTKIGEEVIEFVSTNGDIYAYQFLGVGSKDVEGLTDDLIAQQNSALGGQTVMAAFMANLKLKAEIVRNL